MQRSAMRELAFKLVYEIEVQKDTDSDELDIFAENNNIKEDSVIDYLKDIKEGIKSNETEINTLIEHNLKANWSLNRISKINLSLIKLAIYEMLYKDLPYKVAINEVVELAKKYADETAPVFINGILASVVKEKNLNKEALNED
ncbi:MAG: transcription antitermination factor NusB [Clostridia bacterium]|nr:transcription antitermination factor NusB [Clostridia bacterium]